MHDGLFDYKWEASCPHLHAHEIEDLRSLNKLRSVDYFNGVNKKMTEPALCIAMAKFHEHGRKQIHNPGVYQAYANRIASCELRQHERG